MIGQRGLQRSSAGRGRQILPRLLFVTVVVLHPFVAAHEPDRASTQFPLDEAAVGTVVFENSCAAEVQATFNRGVALLHSFWFAAAIASFDDVLKVDPKCALAEWGKAMSHWGNPLGNNRAKELLREGAAAVARARRLPTGSSRERDYIDAVSALYENFESTDDKSRSVAFEKAMERLVERYPEDSEAAIFYAMALNGSADLTDKTYAQPIRAAKILEAAFEAQPRHPGIAHYLIHSYDVPSLAKHALPAARQYAGIAPAAPHALHMPSHTFTRLGHWQESIDTNLRSADAALAANSPAEALHALDYMVYAYLQTAQDSAAAAAVVRTAQVFQQVAANDRYIVAGGFAAAAVPSRFALERGDWAAAMEVPAVTSPAPFVEAIAHFARGLGAARSGNLELARTSVQALRGSENKLQGNAYWSGRVALSRVIVEAWVRFAAGEPEGALKLMREAVALEDKTEKSAISPGPFTPANEQLGEMLLELERPAEALSAFQRAIEKDAGRFRGLYGGAQAALAAGQPGTARDYYARLISICANADAARPELLQARAYLAEAMN